MSSFQHAIENYDKPWATIVEMMKEQLPNYNNYVVWGEPSEKPAYIHGWMIVGVAPNIDAFLQCSAIGSKNDQHSRETAEAMKSRMLEIIRGFATPEEFRGILPDAIGGMIQASLGQTSVHGLGMLSFHSEVDGDTTFITLWVHPSLDKEIVQYCLKIAFVGE